MSCRSSPRTTSIRRPCASLIRCSTSSLDMFEASVESLHRRDDGAVEIDTYKLDKDVNRFERDVRRKVMTHLVVSGPADLPSDLVLINVVIDIERIGDCAKNIVIAYIAMGLRLIVATSGSN